MSVGLNGKIYRNTGTEGTPTWTEVPEFENVTIDATYDQAEANSRASRTSLVKLGLDHIPITARLKKIAANANYEALADAFALGTAVDLLVLDGPDNVVGSRGYRAYFHLVAASDDQSMSVRGYLALQLLPADVASGFVPKRAKVVTGPALQYAVAGGAFA